MNTTRPLRVLFAPETFNLGETSRAVEVAREVRELGHETLFMGFSRRFADYVRHSGFTLELLDPELSESEADRLIAADQGRTLRHPFTESMVRTRVSSELSLIDRWRPDAIVIGTTLTLFISARAAGVPLAYVRPYAMSRGHLASMTTVPLAPGLGRLSLAANRVAGRLLPRLASAVRWKPASFRRVAADHGVHLPSRTLEALDADINLIASLFPLLDRRPLAQGEIAVGPVFARPDGELPEQVRGLAVRTRPTVYVGLGSSSNRALALDILHQVASGDHDVVSTAGRYLTAADRAALPTNVQLHDFLPAHRLNGLIDASVIHGGEGTVQTACASGVPFAGIGLQLEQRINIDECVRHGNAIRFTPRHLRRGGLTRIVDRLRHDPHLRAVARTLQDAARPVGAAASAEAIIDLARGDDPSSA